MSPTRRELVRVTRTRILDAASRLMRQVGANGFTMDSLAKEAGVARATVYEHFRSKRAVLDELVASTSRTLLLDSPPGNLGEPLTALRDTLGAVCAHWAEHEESIRELRTLVAATGAEPPTDGVDEHRLRSLVGALAASGQLRARWSIDDAVDALAVLTSYPTYERLRLLSVRSPAQIEALLAMLAISIVAPTAPPR